MRKGCIIYVFLITLLCYILVANASAEEQETIFDYAGFQVTDIGEDANIKEFTFLSEQYNQGFINSFDIDENGNIVMSIAHDTDGYIEVFSSEGEFLYGFKHFYYRGGAEIFWYNSNINIYQHNGVITTINNKGEIVGQYNVINNSVSRSRLEELETTRKYHGDKVYELTKGNKFLAKFFSDYGKLTITDNDGNETVIHNQTKELYRYNMTFALVVICGLLFGGIFFAVVVIKFYRSKTCSEIQKGHV